MLLLVFGFSAFMTIIHSFPAFSLLILTLLVLVAQLLTFVHAVVVFSSAFVQLDEHMRTNITPCRRNAGSLHLFLRGNHLGYASKERNEVGYGVPLCDSCCEL